MKNKYANNLMNMIAGTLNFLQRIGREVEFVSLSREDFYKIQKAIPLLRKSEAVSIFGYPLKIGDETFIKTKIEYLQEENHSLKMKIDLLKSEGEKNK